LFTTLDIEEPFFFLRITHYLFLLFLMMELFFPFATLKGRLKEKFGYDFSIDTTSKN